MRVAPQEIRTFFVTSVTNGRRPILESEKMARLLIDVLEDNRRKHRFLLHEFVIMPDHFHLILTPAEDVPLEKALQYITGGFSFRAKRELGYAFLIWQESFANHRIRDAEDYDRHSAYVHENPVEGACASRARLPVLFRVPGSGDRRGATMAKAGYLEDFVRGPSPSLEAWASEARGSPQGLKPALFCRLTRL